jgi:hypothetical protein
MWNATKRALSWPGKPVPFPFFISARGDDSANLLFQMRLEKYCMFLLVTRMSFSAGGQELLPDVSKDSAANRWLNKKVIASRLLDDMDKPAHWTAEI